jgi:hypothetical protein
MAPARTSRFAVGVLRSHNPSGSSITGGGHALRVQSTRTSGASSLATPSITKRKTHGSS